MFVYFDPWIEVSSADCVKQSVDLVKYVSLSNDLKIRLILKSNKADSHETKVSWSYKIAQILMKNTIEIIATLIQAFSMERI